MDPLYFPRRIIRGGGIGGIQVVRRLLDERKINTENVNECLMEAVRYNQREIFNMIWDSFKNIPLTSIFVDIINIQEPRGLAWGFDKYIDSYKTKYIQLSASVGKFESTTDNPDLIKHYLKKYIEYFLYAKANSLTIEYMMNLRLRYYFFRYLETTDEYDEALLNEVYFFTSGDLYKKYEDVLGEIRNRTKNPQVLEYFENVYYEAPTKKLALLHNELAHLEDTFKKLRNDKSMQGINGQLALMALNVGMEELQKKLNELRAEYYNV